MESRLIDLEMKVTYQEQTIAALNEALTGLQRIVDDQGLRLQRVETQLRAAATSDGPAASEEPPPPHY